MSKTTRIIQLINLLHSRRYVSLRAIKDVCGIPERTAYRYLDTISEANIPVYYDRNQNAYTLSRQGSSYIPDVSFGDSIIVALALRVLQAMVNPSYQKTIGQLLIKTFVRQKWELETALGSAVDRLINPVENIDLSEQLSSALIHAAVCCKRDVRVAGRNDTGRQLSAEFTRPGLLFRGTWQLSRNKISGEEFPPLESIQEVIVL